jgi:hypothetical protein
MIVVDEFKLSVRRRTIKPVAPALLTWGFCLPNQLVLLVGVGRSCYRRVSDLRSVIDWRRKLARWLPLPTATFLVLGSHCFLGGRDKKAGER